LTRYWGAITRRRSPFGFQGTPAFIIGHFRIPGALDAATFKQAIADARAAQQRK
jgi:hypothetical protein